MNSFDTKGVDSLNVHRCKVCQLEQRAIVEEWRAKGGLSYRQIQKRMAEEMGVEVALGTIASHFQWLDAEVGEVAAQEVRLAAAAQAGTAMQVFPGNIAYADRVLKGLEDQDGKLRRPQFIPYVASMLKERRESALSSLRYTPADPANQVAQTLSEVVRRITEREEGA